MDMKPEKRYVARVVEFNDWQLVEVMDNVTFALRRFPAEFTMPDYMQERVAMLRMCDVNKSAKGETIGRRTSDTAMLVYLNYHEYTELYNLKSTESAK